MERACNRAGGKITHWWPSHPSFANSTSRHSSQSSLSGSCQSCCKMRTIFLPTRLFTNRRYMVGIMSRPSQGTRQALATVRSARSASMRATGFSIGKLDFLAGGTLLGRDGDKCWQEQFATCANRKGASIVSSQRIPFSPMQRRDGLPVEREGLLQLVRHKFQLGFPR